MGTIDEHPQIFDMPGPELAIDRRCGFEARAIPIARHRLVGIEQLTHSGVVETFPLKMAVAHDVQKSTQRRARQIDPPVGEIRLGDRSLRLNDIIHSVSKGGEVLRFGTEQVFGENAVGVVENTGKESPHESLCDAPAQTTRREDAALELNIGDALQAAMLDEVCGKPFGRRHARPHLGNEQAHIVVHPHLGSDVAGGSKKNRLPREEVRYERGVEIDDRRERIERPFR